MKKFEKLNLRLKNLHKMISAKNEFARFWIYDASNNHAEFSGNKAEKAIIDAKNLSCDDEFRVEVYFLTKIPEIV